MPGRGGIGRAQLGGGAAEGNAAAVPAGARAKIHHAIRRCDGRGIVLYYEHGIALIAQPQQEAINTLAVARVQAGGGLVEDIGDVGKRGAQVANHAGALGLAARKRTGRAGEGEVAQAELDGIVHGRGNGIEQGLRGRQGNVHEPAAQVSKLHLAQVRDGSVLDIGFAGVSGQARAMAVGAGDEDDGALDKGPHVLLQAFYRFAEHVFAQARGQAHVAHVDPADLGFGLGIVEGLFLLSRKLADGNVGRVEAGFGVGTPHPGVGLHAGVDNGAVGKRKLLID